MDKAKGGDATAQFYVGQIYEKGMDSAPDYAEAANWYRKAAASGSNEARLSLAAMMESGHGMPIQSRVGSVFPGSMWIRRSCSNAA